MSTFEKVSDGEHWSKLLYEFCQNGELILRKMDLTELNYLVYEKDLRGINVSDNKIKKIENEIAKIHNLRYLIVTS